MIRVTLTDAERTAVQALRRDATLRPAERDRVEMVLLSAAGWTVPALAQHLGYCAATVRTVLKQFTPTALTSLRRQRPGPPKDWGPRRTRHRGLESPPGRAADLDRRATGPRPPGGGHPAQHAANPQVPQAVRRQLAADRPHAPAQARPRPGGAGQTEAGPPGNKGAQSLLQLASLDECGFSPSLPVTATWVRRGERQRVPYENPQGRRWNTRVLYAPTGVQPAWDWIGKPRAFTAEDFVEFLLERPPCPVPLVIVLDNASLHRSPAVRAALPRLWARRIYFFFLPPYSPELNAIERCFRTIKHDEMPARVYTPLAALEAAVDEAYTGYEATLLAPFAQSDTPLGLAA